MYRKLALEISRGLRRFLDEKIQSVPEDFAGFPPEENSDPGFKVHVCREFYAPEMQAWRATIEKMLWTFEELAKEQADSPAAKYYSQLDDDELTEVIFNNLTPPEILSAETEYQRKIQEGLDLFAKYFRDLFN